MTFSGVRTVASALLLTSSVASCRSNNDTAQAAPPNTAKQAPVLVTVQPVQQVAQQQPVAVSGALEADKTVDLGFLVAGRVSRVNVEEGGRVRAGQVLASLDAASYQFALNATNATLARAQDEYSRLKIMFDRGSLTASDFDKARTAVAQARAQQQQAAKNVRDTRLIALISGQLARRGTDPGEVVGQGIPLFTVVSDGRIVMRAAVPEAEVGEVRTGLTAQVTVPALDSTFTGQLTSVGAVADPASRTYPVKINLANSTGQLRPGMIAEATIASSKRVQVLTIPGEAVVRDPNQLTYVFVADPQRRQAFRRRVQVGAVYDSGVAITSGLQPRELVVVGGQERLRDGVAVQLNQPAP